MKTMLSLVFTMCWICGSAFSNHDSSTINNDTQLAVSVLELRTNSGTVQVALFANEADFINNNALKSIKTEIVAGKAIARITGLPEGAYAIKVFHDANGNGQLDTGIMGIPKEGFGFSNNAMGMFGPPSFSSCVFHLNSTSKEISINLRYL